MKLPDIEMDQEVVLNDALYELLANIALVGTCMFIVGIGILLWYLYVY